MLVGCTWLVSETRDVHAATDLTAETFAQTLCSLRRFRGDGIDSGRAWLYAIARHLLARYRETARLEASARRRLRMPVHHDETGEVEGRVDGAASRRRLLTAVSELPAAQQRAVALRVVDELPYADAKHLECSPTAARLRVSRALRALNKRLEGAEACESLTPPPTAR